jgi:hypothetical protein
MMNNPLFQNFETDLFSAAEKIVIYNKCELQDSDTISTYHYLELFLIDFDYFHDISNGMLSIVRFIA